MKNHTFNSSQPAILVVEDDVIVAEDLKGLLTGFGYRVPGIALNATEALAAVAQQTIDLALLDISLPGRQDGIALAHLLHGQDIPFVFVTAYSDAKTLEAAKQTRPYGYLVKPFSRHDIQPVVEIALYKHRNEQLEKRVVAEQYEKEKALTKLRLHTLEGEQALLLQISNAIATIRDKSSFLHFIETQLTPIFRHKASGVFIVDAAQNYHYDLMVEFDRNEVNEQIRRNVGNHLRHAGTAVAYLMQQPGSGIYDLEALQQQGYDHPHFPTMFAAGIKACLAAGMKVGGESIGLFCLCGVDTTHFSPAQLPLFTAIAEQVAVAVSNILATEEILEREQEKALLLSLSEDMAALRDREELYRVIMKKLRPLIGFDDAVVIHCTDDQQYFHSFLTMATPERKAHPDYRQVITQFIPVKGTHYEHFLEQGDVYVWNLAEIIPHFGHADMGLRLMQETGLHHTVNMKLQQGGHLLGLLLFHFARPEGIQLKNFSLYKSIADQLAVAFSNILAMEALVEQRELREMQLAVNNAVITLPDQESMFSSVAGAMNEVIPIDMLGVLQIDPDSKQVHLQSFLKKNNAFVAVSKSNLLPPASLTKPGTDGEVAALTELFTQAAVLTGEAYLAHCAGNPIAQFACQTWGIRSAIYLPVPVHGPACQALLLGSKSPYAFVEKDLRMIQEVCPQIALATDRRRAFERISALQAQLAQENVYLQEEIKHSHNFTEMVGESAALGKVLAQIQQVAPTNATVLIEGETGTGKELVARAVHNASRRRDKILVKLNCAALPAQLIENELFGHEKGSFTGAFDRQIGKFELANGGTIFLDEIGELPLELQTKLLRAIQEREIERIGGKGPIPLDVRLIAATNKRLEDEVKAGHFRADLFFRLNVFPIQAPPLRERKEDIPVLALHFAQKYGQKMGKKIKQIHAQALEELKAYAWPGNIREMEHVIEHAVIVSASSTLELGRPLLKLTALTEENVSPQTDQQSSLLPRDVVRPLHEFERKYILQVLQHTNGRIRGKGGAAELLALKPTTLEAKMAKLNIQKEKVFK